MMKTTPIATAAAAVLTGMLAMACGGMPSASVTPPQDAITALERACLLDPTNAAHWARLATALEADGQRQRATRFYQQAATLSAHDARRDYALLAASGGAGATATVSATTALAAVDPYADMPRTQVHRLGAAMVQVLRVEAPPAAVAQPRLPVSAPTPATPASASTPATLASASMPAEPVRLEISNGNGVTGAAARLARTLDLEGLTTVRLTNARPFIVPHTLIEYSPAQREMAEELSQRLEIPLKVRRQGAPHALRIVLGHDIAHR